MYKGVILEQEKKSFEEAIDSLHFADLPRLPLQKGEVRVRVLAASLNFFDLLMMVGKYQSKPSFPFVPGSEGSGEVIEVGEGVDRIKEGEKVIFGMTSSTIAAELIVPSALLIKHPPFLSPLHSTAIPVGFSTAYHGLIQRGKLKAGEKVLVTGAGGGMGLAAIQLAKMAGGEVIAAASTAEKLEAARRMGADHLINYSPSNPPLADQVKSLVGSVDLVYEIVGGQIFSQCMRVVGSEGRLLVIGFASGEIAKVPMNLPLVKGYSIVGVRAGASMFLYPSIKEEIFAALEGWGNEGKLEAPYVQQVYEASKGIDEVKEAFRTLASRRALGKLVISFSSPPSASL